MRVWLIVAWVAACVFACTADAGAISDPFAEQAGAYLITVDGRPLWGRDAERPLPPASLTKIMTGLIVIERARMDDVVTVGRHSAAQDGSRIGIRAGERYYVGALLGATLIRSANDACMALAEHVGGSEAGFVKLMNQRAQELGLRHTSFNGACGFDQDGHYSTASDLAVLASAAMHNASYRAIAGMVRAEISDIGGKRTFRFENRNELLGRYPGVVGVKSGFTNRAGKCVIALVERGGHGIMLVLLNSPDRWWTAERMLNEAISNVTAGH